MQPSRGGYTSGDRPPPNMLRAAGLLRASERARAVLGARRLSGKVAAESIAAHGESLGLKFYQFCVWNPVSSDPLCRALPMLTQ